MKIIAKGNYGEYVMTLTQSRGIMKRCHLGKHWPLVTTCEIRREEQLVGFGEVVKHAKDEDQQFYAYTNAAKKATVSLIEKSVRKQFFTAILAHFGKK